MEKDVTLEDRFAVFQIDGVFNDSAELSADSFRLACSRIFETLHAIVEEHEMAVVQQARRMLDAAKNVVLPNGGERIVFICGADQEAMRVELGKRVASEVSREGDRYTIELIVPDENGLIHDDDFRTPLHRITCTTCVSRIAESRTQRRLDARIKREGPKAIAVHSRLIAEAYTRLAETEEALQERWDSDPLQK